MKVGKTLDMRCHLPMDQNEIFNRLPLSASQKQKLYEDLMREHANGNPQLKMNPIVNTACQYEGDLKVELDLEAEYASWEGKESCAFKRSRSSA